MRDDANNQGAHLAAGGMPASTCVGDTASKESIAETLMMRSNSDLRTTNRPRYDAGSTGEWDALMLHVQQRGLTCIPNGESGCALLAWNETISASQAASDYRLCGIVELISPYTGKHLSHCYQCQIVSVAGRDGVSKTANRSLTWDSLTVAHSKEHLCNPRLSRTPTSSVMSYAPEMP